jgi:hypothetical protein
MLMTSQKPHSGRDQEEHHGQPGIPKNVEGSWDMHQEGCSDNQGGHDQAGGDAVGDLLKAVQEDVDFLAFDF